MTTRLVAAKAIWVAFVMFASVAVAQAQIHITDAEIGCLNLKQNDAPRAQSQLQRSIIAKLGADVLSKRGGN